MVFDRGRCYGKITTTSLEVSLSRYIEGFMDTPLNPRLNRVIILKSDRLYAESLRQYVLHLNPRATVTIAISVESALELLVAHKVDVLVSGVGYNMDGDVLDMLAKWNKISPVRTTKVLIVTARREYRVLVALRTLAVDGVYDSAAEVPETFSKALQLVAGGRRYWSPSIIEHMYQVGSASTAVFRLLTSFEQVVLSVIGDGCDNTAAARELNLSPATVSTVRRELHRKLGVQHRGELVRVAAQHGFVRFTPAGVVRPGFAMMRASYMARRSKRSRGASTGISE